ncbi:glycosyltransferase [Faecalimonas umbilicata]|uniref:glycosyltransferase n=1 Tax=Faecalimonas umbilicata TaxID=1912855 RepID=UPI00399FFC84
MKPKVSIIVPVYKTKETLEKCVNSLLEQTLQEIEIILVDDGSLDESGEMCDSFSKDLRVHVVHKENGGLSSARNAGLKIASGDYIGFVDSDDYVHPEMFYNLYNRIEKDKSEICICSHFTVGSAGNVVEHHFHNVPKVLNRSEIFKMLILPMIGIIPGTNEKEIEGFVCRNLYRKEIISDYKFKSEREFFAEDVISAMELYKECEKISVLDECLYYYKYNGESLSNTYRPKVYKLLNNLLEWEKAYLKKEQLFEQEKQRLFSTGVKFLIFSIQNIKKGNLGKKREQEEAKNVLEQSMIRESLYNIDIFKYGWKMKILVLLSRCSCIKLLLRVL